MKIFAGSSNLGLAKKIAKKAGLNFGKIEVSRFKNDESRILVKEDRLGKEAVVVQSLSQPTDHNLIEFNLICDALKRMGVKEITAVIPWLGYSKQDKVFRQGEPLSVKVIAKMLQVISLEKIITFDLHNLAILGFFEIPVINLSARLLLEDYFLKKINKNTIVVAPDAGAIKLSTAFAHKLGIGVVYIDKKRDLKTGKVKIFGISGGVKGKEVIIIDDMIATGGTLIKTANFLRKKGVQSIKVGVTHHLYVNGTQEKLEKSAIDEIVVTDTIKPKIKSKKLKVLSVAEIITKEIV
ncbi:MAG: ribose-phosphate pyrophosphokinase [Patescibacteria group bacterium]|nr:ribose-phosphate pyrophosphokinase [Patescibacteria group bacterium]